VRHPELHGWGVVDPKRYNTRMCTRGWRSALLAARSVAAGVLRRVVGPGLFALVTSCGGAGRAPANASSGSEPGVAPTSSRPTVASIVSRARASVVVIRTEVGLGTGFIVAPNVIATNLHVLINARSAELHFADGTSSVTDAVLKVDPSHDLALLPLHESSRVRPPLVLGDDAHLHPGDAIVALGTPQGLDFTVSTGIVGAIREVNRNLTLLQITAPISPGSSGGPLFDEQGTVVGVTTLTMTRGQNLNFAVPARYVRALLEQPDAPLLLAQQPRSKPKQTAEDFEPHTTEKPYPEAVAGFRLGMTFADAKHACPGIMKSKLNRLECSSAPVPVPFAGGPVVLYFGNGRLVSVELLATSPEGARLALTNRYGAPRDPRAANAEIDRSASDTTHARKKVPIDASVHLRWSFAHGGSISVDEQPSGRCFVVYTAPVWDDSRNY
jgi:S1-C subfamily serine protease